MSKLLQLVNTGALSAVAPPSVCGMSNTILPATPSVNNVMEVNAVIASSGDAQSSGQDLLANAPSVNPSSFWVGNNTAPSSSNVVIDCTAGKASGVSEACFKEALTCEVSPLGYHLSSNIKEKIWKHDFIDLLSFFYHLLKIMLRLIRSLMTKRMREEGLRLKRFIIGYRPSVFIPQFWVNVILNCVQVFFDIWIIFLRRTRTSVVTPGSYTMKCIDKN